MCFAISRAFLLWVRTRKCTVRSPRCSSQASKEERQHPSLRRTFRMFFHNNEFAILRFATRTPASTSLCPFRYFVAECITMSAPKFRGWLSTGVAAVLSTTQNAPMSCAMLEISDMSETDQVGLAGVSSQTNFGRVDKAERSLFLSKGSPKSRAFTSIFHLFAKSMIHPLNAQYITRGTMTWSPGRSILKTAVAADIPDENKRASAPNSSSLMVPSAASTVGLSSRA
mmetsp:Transcript_18516/g.60799  ORF Transcript_18516/g.60799 Transcript_18516/m.60799 type:complete len:227 (-) Transcript_18516:237-917(-)